MEMVLPVLEIYTSIFAYDVYIWSSTPLIGSAQKVQDLSNSVNFEPILP